MNTTFATWAGRVLALAIVAVGLAAVAISLGLDPAPLVDLVNDLTR